MSRENLFSEWNGLGGVLSPRCKPVLHALEEVKFLSLRLHGSLLLHPSGVLRTLLELLTNKDEVTKGLGKSLVFLFNVSLSSKR